MFQEIEYTDGKYKQILNEFQNNTDQKDGQKDDRNEKSNVTGQNQVSEEEETDFQKRLLSCNNNPGHTKFIPFDKFTLKHLPEGHRENDLYQFLKTVADLTVRVDVKITFTCKQKSQPNTSAPLQTSVLKTGSGRLWNMTKYTDGISQYRQRHRANCAACPCLKCSKSGSPSKAWWEVYVETAAHVVLSETDSTDRSCRLFYDGEEDEGNGVILDKVLVDQVDIDNNSCLLICVTCDAGLADRLDRMWRQFDELWQRVCAKYMKRTDEARLSFIVSHPHGRPKHVSVNQWRTAHDVADDLFHNKLTYSPCTCPDSRGAFIYVVGFEWGLGAWHQSAKV